MGKLGAKQGPAQPAGLLPHLLAAAAGTVLQRVRGFQLALAAVQGPQAAQGGVDRGTVDRTAGLSQTPCSPGTRACPGVRLRWALKDHLAKQQLAPLSVSSVPGPVALSCLGSARGWGPGPGALSGILPLGLKAGRPKDDTIQVS